MSFMQPCVTPKQDWYMVDGPCGTEWIPIDLVGKIDLPEECDQTIPDELKDYCENRKAWSIELVTGYGARMSASGYMDCTDWCVFDTPEEAEDYLREYYMDDDEETND